MVRVDVADEIEAVETVGISAAPLVVGVVLVLGIGFDAASVGVDAAKGVLGLSVEPAPGATAERDIEGVGRGASAGFDLLDKAERGVGACGVGRADRRIGIAGTEA